MKHTLKQKDVVLQMSGKLDLKQRFIFAFDALVLGRFEYHIYWKDFLTKLKQISKK